jgi:hypothetical protein
MVRMLRSLGIGLVVAVAVAVAAAPAWATEFHDEVGGTSLVGSQAAALEFEVEGGTIGCEKGSASGEMAGTTATELTLSEEHESCQRKGNTIIWHRNGCNDVITSNGIIHIVCPTGKEIEVTESNPIVLCTWKIKPQTPGGKVAYTDQGSGKTRDVLITYELEVSYTHEGFSCGKGAGVGPYRNSMTVKGMKGGEQDGFWVE